MTVVERLAALRQLMAQQGLSAYYVPSTDPHASEYVAEVWQRRAFISGFNGSAGTVVVTPSKAGLWTDSRYFLQAESQLAGSGIDLFKMGEPGVPEVETWLAQELKPTQQLGLDARVVTAAAYDGLRAALAPAGIVLKPVHQDLVEQVWGQEIPAMPSAALRIHRLEWAGATVAQKLAAIRTAMAAEGADAHVVAALDEVAWLTNLRGGDVQCNPVFIAYALVERGNATLFVEPGKVTPEVRDALAGEFALRPYQELDLSLHEICLKKIRVWVDPATVNQAIVENLGKFGADVLRKTGPIAALKGAKNVAEIAGMRASHVRDGLAMVKLLAWLKEAVENGFQTELSVAKKAEELRSEHPYFVGLSFSSIVAYGPHGAIVHYSPTEESDAALSSDGILLIDSGAQYLDGTTDITRTVALGHATPFQKRAYTAVLKGHLALARTHFPVGTNGYQLDAIARAPLWENGFQYGHGTGHGVGAALSVHEGPFSISLRRNMTPLVPGNITSNEPGFYKAGAFGIRIENLMLVREAGMEEGVPYLGLEPLTLCPYCRDLIDVELLTATEIRQVNDYHRKVMEALGPELPRDVRNWLSKATAAI